MFLTKSIPLLEVTSSQKQAKSVEMKHSSTLRQPDILTNCPMSDNTTTQCFSWSNYEHNIRTCPLSFLMIDLGEIVTAPSVFITYMGVTFAVI